MMQLTVEQTAALAAQNRSVSLEAGAGCGKTFVLTERYLSYLDPAILEPLAELEELVAITFTDAAAREMRERIRQRCIERIEQASVPAERQDWRKIQRSLDAARISTIHSFCGNLLRSYAAEAAVDPQFVLLNQSSADLLKLQVTDDRLRQLLFERDERLLQLASELGLARLREVIVSLLDSQLPQVQQRWSAATPEQVVDTWKKFFAEQLLPAAVAELLQKPAMKKLRELCREAPVAAAELTSLLERIESLFVELEALQDVSQNLAELFELAKATGPGKKKNWLHEETYGLYRDTCKEIREKLIPAKSLLRQGWNNQLALQSAERGLDLLALTADVARCHASAKQEQNVLDFDDLLGKAYQLLTAPQFKSVQRKLATGTRLLMVDEFQDTDPLQVAIVQAFCGENWAKEKLFVVGDFKQSIYRFRGAAPAVSQQLRRNLPKESRLSLTKNFRSQGAILDFVNALFFDAFTQPYEPLRPSRSQLTPEPSVEFLWSPKSGDTEEHIPEQFSPAQRARFLEARFLAHRIAQLIDTQEPLIVDQSADEQHLRPLRSGDIAVLLRALSDAHLYEAAFAEVGLEIFLVGGHAFYAQQEIHDILHLLRSLVSETDEISLAGVLRSPVFSLTDESLFWLQREFGSLHSAIRCALPPEELDGEQRRRVLRAAAILAELRAEKDRLLVSELLKRALALTGLDAILLSEFLGRRKLANLYKLIEQAHEHDQTAPGDLAGFVTQLSEYVTRDPKEALAATTSAGDVIQMMTIHNAKGLEFPFVVLPDLDRKNRDDSPLAVFSPELGPLVKMDEEGLTGMDLFRFVERREDREERLRLLYVACTRAADYLLLSSSLEDLERPKEDWLRHLAGHFNLETGECICDLPAGYQAPQIRVTTSLAALSRDIESKARGADLQDCLVEARKHVPPKLGPLPKRIAPIPPSLDCPRRFSFSRLSGQLWQVEAQASEIELDGKALPESSREIGTLVHSILEHLPLAGPELSPQRLESFCNAEAESMLLSELAAEEAMRLVRNFLNSSRYASLRRAKHVLREVEFLLPWRAEVAEGVSHYLQGYIDCVYLDQQGQWHLLDYKTNAVGDADEVASHYAMQLYTYAAACTQTLGAAPVEQTICFLRPQVEHSFVWSDADHAAIEGKINQAIRAILESETQILNDPVQ